MAHFDKNSPEYIENGHYEIGGIEFMSVWSFKNKNHIQPNNTAVNGSEGKELTSKYKNFHTSTPDIGGYSRIFIYKTSDLEDYYGV